MYFGATFDFKCDRKILEIQSQWNAAGPYAWSAFDNDQYGAYIVTRKPDINLRIKLFGEQPNYSLEIDCDVPAETIGSTKAGLLSIVFDQLLPAIEASAIRDTSRETSGGFPQRP